MILFLVSLEKIKCVSVIIGLFVSIFLAHYVRSVPTAEYMQIIPMDGTLRLLLGIIQCKNQM